MNTIYIDSSVDGIPDHPPVEKVNPDEKWIKHVNCNNARFHVVSYIGVTTKGWHTVDKVITRCSEPDCILNKPESEGE